MKISIDESLRTASDAFDLALTLVPQTYIDVIHRNASEMRPFAHHRDAADAMWAKVIAKQATQSVAIIDRLESFEFTQHGGSTRWLGCIAALRVCPNEPLPRRTPHPHSSATTAAAFEAFTAWANGDHTAINLIGANK